MSTAKDQRIQTQQGLGVQILLLLLIVLFCVFPFYWMVTTSLKTQVLALESPPVWLFEPTFQNYSDVLTKDGVKDPHQLVNCCDLYHNSSGAARMPGSLRLGSF